MLHRIQQVATYLIIYRVADGTAWTKNSMDSAALTTMNFNTRNGTEANRKNQGRVGRPAGTSMELTRDSSYTGINAVESDPNGMMESGELNEKVKAHTCET